MLMLPADVLEKILENALRRGYVEFIRAKATCKTLRDLSESDELYKNINFFYHHINLFPREAVHTLVDNCITQGNPTTLVLKEISNYIYKDKKQEGESMLKKSSKERWETWKYIYYMFVCIFDGQEEAENRGLLLSRELARKVRLEIVKRGAHPWREQPCNMLLQKEEELDLLPFITCNCTTINQWLYYYNDGWKEWSMCDECFWTIESLIFCRIVKDNFLTWPKT